MLCDEPDFSVLPKTENYLNWRDHGGFRYIEDFESIQTRYLLRKNSNNIPKQELCTFLERLINTNVRDLWERPPLHNFLAKNCFLCSQMEDIYFCLKELLAKCENHVFSVDLNGWNVLHEAALSCIDSDEDVTNGKITIKQAGHVMKQLLSVRDKFGRTPTDLLPFRFVHKELSILSSHLEPCPPSNNLLLLLRVNNWHQAPHFPDTVKLIQDLKVEAGKQR